MTIRSTHHAKESGLGKPMRAGRVYPLVSAAVAAGRLFGVSLVNGNNISPTTTRPLWDSCQRSRKLGCAECRLALAQLAKRIRGARLSA